MKIFRNHNLLALFFSTSSLARRRIDNMRVEWCVEAFAMNKNERNYAFKWASGVEELMKWHKCTNFKVVTDFIVFVCAERGPCAIPSHQQYLFPFANVRQKIIYIIQWGLFNCEKIDKNKYLRGVRTTAATSTLAAGTMDSMRRTNEHKKVV